jgi:hypothetical protein
MCLYILEGVWCLHTHIKKYDGLTMQTWSSTVLSHRPKYVRGKKHTNVCMYVYIYTRTHTSYRHQWSAYIHTFTYTYIMHTSIPAHTSAADTSGQSKQRSSPARQDASRRIQTHQVMNTYTYIYIYIYIHPQTPVVKASRGAHQHVKTPQDAYKHTKS